MDDDRTKVTVSVAIGIICFIVLEIMTLSSGTTMLAKDGSELYEIDNFGKFLLINFLYMLISIIVFMFVFISFTIWPAFLIIGGIIFIKFVLYKIFIGG